VSNELEIIRPSFLLIIATAMKNPSFCRLLLLALLQLFFASEILANTLILMCTRTERDFSETYELKLQSISQATPKGKVYLDGRDLDVIGSEGRQFVKNVTITKQKASYLLSTQFDAEVLEGISYSAGSVTSIVMIDRETGKLRKLDTIQGGILGANLGDGTKSYEEQCIAQP
jgi:hypothetical protein